MYTYMSECMFIFISMYIYLSVKTPLILKIKKEVVGRTRIPRFENLVQRYCMKRTWGVGVAEIS